jgi:protoheme ferro-lyase
VYFGPWAFLLGASVAGGAATCAAMIVPRRLMVPAGAAGTFFALTASAAVARIWQSSQRPDALIAALFLAAGAAVGGFALASTLTPSLTRGGEPATRLGTAPGGDKLSVVLLADQEPEEYDPRSVTAVFDRYGLSDVPLPPDVARPLVYASERSSYHRVNGSPARDSVRRTAAALESRLRDDGTASEVTVAYTSGGPSLAETVVLEVEKGATRIVVAALTVAWTGPFDSAVARASSLGLAGSGVRLETTGPLWTSEHVSAMIAQRALASLGSDRSGDGVVLVSAGEPQQLERDHPAATEQTTFFSQRVRAELIEAGLASGRIRRAWLEWEEPDVLEAVRHLAAVGARRIALVPVTFPAETIATLVDLRFAAERATEETGASLVVLGAWGDDPAVVEALRDGVVEATARFGRD